MEKEKSSSLQTPQAIPFITYSPSEGFSLNKEAEDFLNSLDKNKKLGVISIVGKYRTGKSFFVNRVLLNKQKSGFKVGSTVNACTKGLWLWKHPLSSENESYSDMDILVIDTEGFGGTDENINHDNKIFIFSLLLSTYFIFNSVGHIDENALNNLSLIINLAKEIQSKAHNSQQGEELVNSFPAFLWVVRDFALKLVDKEGNSMKPKDYLEQALELQKGVSDSVESKNRIRRMFKHFFKDRDCITLIRPCEKETDLQKMENILNENLRAEFVNQANLARHKIMRKTRPKTLKEKFLNGSMLVELSKVYIEAINQGGVPNIDNAWKYIVKNESYKNLQENLQLIDEEISALLANDSVEFDEKKLNQSKDLILEKILINFKKKAIGEETDLIEYLNTLKKEFKKKFMEFKIKNEEKIQEKYAEFGQKRLFEIEDSLKSDHFLDFYEFEIKFRDFLLEIQNKFPPTISRNNYISEISVKFYKMAAEIFTKKSQFLYDNDFKLLKSRTEILEKEYHEKKSEWLKERSDLQKLIEENNNEKAINEGNFKNCLEKIKILSEEKKELVQKVENAQSKAKVDEQEFNFKYEELKIELEHKFNDIVEEYSQIQTESEKRIALLEQENFFLKKENEKLYQDSEKSQIEISNFRLEIETLSDNNENLQKQISDLEIKKQQELLFLKNEFEKKIKEILEENAEPQKKALDKNKAEAPEFLIEKTYLQNQINLLTNQLQENKRLYDGLYIALQQNLRNHDTDFEELLETNKNLSTTVETMNIRCKVQEEKLEKLRIYKHFWKNSNSFKCIICNNIINNSLFLKHISKCNEQMKTLNNSINLSKSNISNSIMNMDSQKKKMIDYKSSFKQNPKKHQSIHYDNEFNKKSFLNGKFDVSDLGEFSLEIEKSNDINEFILFCSFQNFQWKLLKRYISFCELYQNIRLAFPGVVLPESCNIFTSSDNYQLIKNEENDFVFDKRMALQNFLQDLAKIDFIKKSNYFMNFIEFQKNIENFVRKETNGDLKKFFNCHLPKNSNDSLDFLQSKLLESNNKEKNLQNINCFFEKSIDLTTEFYENGVLANKDIMNSGSKNSESFVLNIDKKHMPISPQSYLKKWDSEIQKKGGRTISEFFCDLNQNTTLNYERQGNSKKTDRSFDFATSEHFKENKKEIKSKNLNDKYKTPSSNKRQQTQSKSIKSKTPIEKMKNIVTYVGKIENI